MTAFLITDLTHGSQDLILEKSPMRAIKQYLRERGIQRTPKATDYTTDKYVSYRVKPKKGSVRWYTLN